MKTKPFQKSFPRRRESIDTAPILDSRLRGNDDVRGIAKGTTKFFVTCFFVFCWTILAFAQEVIRHPSQTQPLTTRWQWSLENAPNSGSYWVGYSIERLMHENSFMGHFNSEHPPTEVVLHELIYGEKIDSPVFERKSDDEVIRDLAKRNLQVGERKQAPAKKVLKEVALLFFYDKEQSGVVPLHKIYRSNVALAFDFKGFPLVWLGKARDHESVPLLAGLYDRIEDHDQKARLVSTVGVHDDSELVVPHLRKYVFDGETKKIRKNAVCELGRHNKHAEVPGMLEKVAFSDPEVSVQKDAAYRISQLQTATALPILKDLVDRHPELAVKKSALYRISQKGPEHAVSQYLANLIFRRGMDYSLQKEALYRTSQYSPEISRPILTRVLQEHSDLPLRKNALYRISQKKNDGETLAILEKTVFAETEFSLQKEALYRISQRREKSAREALIKIARTHHNEKLRGSAIYRIAQTKSDDAVVVLSEIAFEDASHSLQKKAVYRLAQIPSDASVKNLKEIAQKHQSVSIRKEAIYRLGRMKNKAARAALIGLTEQE